MKWTSTVFVAVSREMHLYNRERRPVCGHWKDRLTTNFVREPRFACLIKCIPIFDLTPKVIDALAWHFSGNENFVSRRSFKVWADLAEFVPRSVTKIFEVWSVFCQNRTSSNSRVKSRGAPRILGLNDANPAIQGHAEQCFYRLNVCPVLNFRRLSRVINCLSGQNNCEQSRGRCNTADCDRQPRLRSCLLNAEACDQYRGRPAEKARKPSDNQICPVTFLHARHHITGETRLARTA